jgi:hypothetical protein
MALTEHEQAELASHHNHRIETYKSMVSISVESFKFLALLNGGAAAGMLATIDKLRVAIQHDALQNALSYFVFGLGCNGCAMLFSYVTQVALYNESIGLIPKNRHRFTLYCSLIFTLASLMAFCVGAFGALDGLKP